MSLRNALEKDNSFFLVFLSKELSKGRPNSENYKRFPKEWVSGRWCIVLGDGKSGGGVSGKGNRTDKSREV